jgi:hypothetical protein
MGFGVFIHRSDSIYTDRPGQHTERTASFMQQPGDQKPNGQRAAKNKNPAEEVSRKLQSARATFVNSFRTKARASPTM